MSDYDPARFSVRHKERIVLEAPDEGGLILGVCTYLREGGAGDFPLTVLERNEGFSFRYPAETRVPSYHYWGRFELTPEHTLRLELPRGGP